MAKGLVCAAILGNRRMRQAKVAAYSPSGDDYHRSAGLWRSPLTGVIGTSTVSVVGERKHGRVLGSEEMGMDFRSGHSQGSVPMRGNAGVTDRLLLTSQEAAKALAVSERTLWTLTQIGEIPCVRLNRSKRYSVIALQDWVAKHSVSNNKPSATSVQTPEQDVPVTIVARQPDILPADYMTISTMN